MSQKTTGIRAFLSNPSFYSWFSRLIGAVKTRKILVHEYVRANAGDRVLDIGCGPADILEVLPRVEYVGFDLSSVYIDAAKECYGERATFLCAPVNTATLKDRSFYDIVLAIGCLHHLNDEEALQLFHLAKDALKPGGRLITFDGVLEEGQPMLARWLIMKDRGQHVRTRGGYYNLASKEFSDVNVNIRHDLLRIPYTHIILECTKGYD